MEILCLFGMKEQDYGAEQIESFEGLDAVRKRPGMYIGSTSKAGLHHILYEVIDNSVDEAMAEYASEISVTINDDHLIVEDDGRGIPIEDKNGVPTVNVIMTELHVGGKFDSDAYEVSGGLHGVGVSVVNALSTKLVTEIKRNGFVWRQTFVYGEPQDSKNVEKVREMEPDEKTGTKIKFWPDGDVFETLEYNYETVRSRIKNLAYLNPGLKLNLKDNREDYEKRDETFKFDGGISEFVENLNEGRETLTDIIRMQGEDWEAGDKISVDIAMQYTTSTQSSDSSLYSFANNIETVEGGTHETGFKTSLTRVVNKYAEKNGLLEEIGGDRFDGSIVREGLTVVISVKHSDPQFEGQTKAKLSNANARGVVSSLVTDKLSRYLEEHPEEAETIVSKAIEAYKAKEAAEKAEELTRKSATTTNTRLPGKLSDCQRGTDPEDAELFLVEGDSAGGSARQARNPETQAVLPLRGKILNVEKNRLDRILEHDQIQNIITALGTGVNDEFNIDDLRYNTIVMFVDADVDGAHIKTLLLTFFFRHMPELLENGHVYAAKSPLYRIKDGGETYDAMTDEERERIIEEECGGNPTNVQRFKGLGEMNPKQLWNATMDPDQRRLERITIEDAARADRLFSILMGSEVEPRREFIKENAQEVNWIDI